MSKLLFTTPFPKKGNALVFKVDYHGDDYAASVHNSQRMLELVQAGKLDSISILPNMRAYDECISLLKTAWRTLSTKPLISVHINLIDGLSLSKSTNPIMVNAMGNIDSSWGKYFLHSFIPGTTRKELKTALTAEIAEQIKRVYGDLKTMSTSEVPLRLDSHVHTHMIPIVFDALLDALLELHLLNKVEYVRVSREPLSPFLTSDLLRGVFPYCNLIKNILLGILSERVLRYLKQNDVESGLLWGLIMSGTMDRERISKYSAKVLEYAQKKKVPLEILCHPGRVLREETSNEISELDMAFFSSSNRDMEYNAVANRSI